jgi:GNAT superfamily N-acetyltransferase
MLAAIRSWPRRIRDSLRQEGTRSALMRFLLSPVYRAAAVLVRPIDVHFDERSPVQTRPMSEDDAEAMAKQRLEYDPAALKQRLRRGHRCFLSVVSGDIVSWRWVSTGKAEMGELDLVLPLREDEIYTYDFYTVPGARGKQVGRSARRALDEEYQSRGFHTVVSIAALGRGPYGAGNRWQAATIRTLRLGPFRKVWVKTYGPHAERWRETLKELRWA